MKKIAKFLIYSVLKQKMLRKLKVTKLMIFQGTDLSGMFEKKVGIK